MKVLFLLLVSLSFPFASADEMAKGFTSEQMKFMADANEKMALRESQERVDDRVVREGTAPEVLAFAEYQKAGYLIISSAFRFKSLEAKKRMAQNLPDGVKLVVYSESQSKSGLKKIENQFAQWIEKDRLEVITVPDARNGFWARDGVPVPVWRKSSPGAEPRFTVVDAKYYYDFESDRDFADYFSAVLTSHKFYYEGGNFMSNTLGDCMLVNTNAAAKVPDHVMSRHYGCKKLIRLPYEKGIGHVDESIKFMTDRIVITDEPSYIPILEKEGFEVVKMPRPDRPLETYVNALLINGVAFVPVFDEVNDQKALEIYEKQGYKVVPLPSKTLSNTGKGSIHCITMVYPPMAIEDLVEAVDGSLAP